MTNKIISVAKKTLAVEAAAINGLENFINDSFVKAVEAVHTAQGRFVISGIGKSSIIAQKIVATCNSTGTPSGENVIPRSLALCSNFGLLAPGLANPLKSPFTSLMKTETRLY